MMRLLKKLKSLSPKRNTLAVYSPSKLNLYLNVVGKYSTGYHQIETVINRISLCDKIEFTLLPETKEIKFRCNIAQLQNEENLCVKAGRLLYEKFQIPMGVAINLTKCIPVGAGMGGGSSNAAYTLRVLQELFRLPVSKQELLQLGSQLGSDVNFFLRDVPWAFVRGKGSEVNVLKTNLKVKYLVVFPGFNLSTGAVYNQVNVSLTKYVQGANIIKHAIVKRDIPLMRRVCFNSLESAAIKVNSNVLKVRTFLEERGFFCFLTGSGSAFASIITKNNSCRVDDLKRNQHIRKLGWSMFEVQTH